MPAKKYSAMLVLVTQSRVGRSRRGHLVKYGVVAVFFYKEGFRRRRVLLPWEVSLAKYKSCRICTLPLYSNSRDSVQLGLPLRQSHQRHIQHEGGKLATCFITAVNILAYLYLYFIEWFEFNCRVYLGPLCCQSSPCTSLAASCRTRGRQATPHPKPSHTINDMLPSYHSHHTHISQE